MLKPYALLMFGGIAHAAPIDVDGTPVELGADGVLHVGAQTVHTGAGKLSVAHARGVAQLVVDTGKEAVIVIGGKEVARVPLGGVGLDSDFAYAIDATPAGIYRYQARADIRRCDGKPAYLFAEGFDGKQFRRLSKLPAELPDNASALIAKPDAAAPAPVVFRARAASLEPNASDAGSLGIPSELDDGDPNTAWREELAASAGEGQFFTFESRVDGAKAKELRFVPAAKLDRPAQIAIVAVDKAWTVELPAKGDAFAIALPEAVSCVTVVLLASHGTHTGIGELEVFAEGERAGGGEAVLAHAIATGSNAQAAAAALAKLGPHGAQAIEAELANADAAARQRLIRALLGFKEPPAGPLISAATRGWVRDQDLLDVMVALHGNSAASSELAKARALPIAARVLAVRGIIEVAPLVELAGGGPREIRHAIIASLAALALPQLIDAAKLEVRPGAAADLYAALGRKKDPRAIDVLVAALPNATDYERRYRIVESLAMLGAVDAIDPFLRGLPASAETAAIRQIAIRAALPSPAAGTFIARLADDPDPGVRLAALTVLATVELDADSTWHVARPDDLDRAIGNRLADHWPEVRRRAAESLGTRCQRPGPAQQLAATVGHDRDPWVRTSALAALVQCHAPTVPALLAALWDDGKAPVELRDSAVDLAGDDPTLAARLVSKYTQWRGAALESKEALELAQHAAAAIGRARAPGAATALAAGLDDGAFPELVISAALGLGALGPACPASAKQHLTLLARGDNPDVAVAAKRAAAQCGR